MQLAKKYTQSLLYQRPALLLLLVVMVMLVLLFAGAFYRTSKEKLWPHENSAAHIPRVKLLKVEPHTEGISLALPSTLVAYNATPILARTNGYLKQFYVDIGDHVQKDQLLAEIYVPDIEAKEIQAEADLKNSRAKYEIAKITAERWAKLYADDPEAISKEEVDQTAAAKTAAEASLHAAESNLSYAQIQKEFSRIIAPFEGVIVQRNVDIGSLVSIGNESLTLPYVDGGESLKQPLFKISSVSTLRAFVEVPQPYYPQIKDGTAVKITVPEYPDEVFDSVIDRNAYALDQPARTLLTQINVVNKDNKLRPGLFVEAHFTFMPYMDYFIIPISALIIRNGPPLVAILGEDNMIKMQEIQIGKDFGKSLQIIQGLKKGDQVIVNPSYKISEGVEVKIAPEPVDRS